MTLSTISAFRKILTSYEFKTCSSRPEHFAQKRYAKKMEIPDELNSLNRKQKCFEDFIEFDRQLPKQKLLSGDWYKARLLLHNKWKHFKLGDAVFTNGSTLTPTRGLNSLESRLMRNKWECTAECFDLWSEVSFHCRALRVATKMRFRASCYRKGDNYHQIVKSWWKESSLRYPEDNPRHKRKRVFEVFKRMLSHVTFVVVGSRFSTVRKNNEKDRSIDLQPLCNMVVQRCIGVGIRDLLKQQFGLDLNNLASQHGLLIKLANKATIDLRNASDSITTWLCEHQLPKSAFRLINESRTSMTFGLDKNFHVLQKVSSMGNGFTFELMTLLLLCIGKQLDSNFSVFGDDIIIENDKARVLIERLTEVGFLINEEKSFISSEFRESCGYNYLEGYGYIESYDFEYPNSIIDCITVYNKVANLSHYPSFKVLKGLLARAIPKALRGAQSCDKIELGGYRKPVVIDTHFACGIKNSTVEVESVTRGKVNALIKDCYQYEGPVRFFNGFDRKIKDYSPPRLSLKMRYHYGKYFMYLHGGSVSRDLVTGSEYDVMVTLIQFDNRVFRLSNLLKVTND